MATSHTVSSGPTGPQIISSLPANGDQAASLSPFAFLTFDRTVSFSSALGKITVSSTKAPTPVAVQTFPCPSGDVACIAIQYPMSFSTNNQLPGGLGVTITLSKDFADTNGVKNTVDQTVAYKTFSYDPAFFDDSTVQSGETGGIDFDSTSNALFLGGTDGQNAGYVRKIPFTGMAPQPAVTVAKPVTMGGGPEIYGLDINGGVLYLAETYAGKVSTWTGNVICCGSHSPPGLA